MDMGDSTFMYFIQNKKGSFGKTGFNSLQSSCQYYWIKIGGKEIQRNFRRKDAIKLCFLDLDLDTIYTLSTGNSKTD